VGRADPLLLVLCGQQPHVKMTQWESCRHLYRQAPITRALPSTDSWAKGVGKGPMPNAHACPLSMLKVCISRWTNIHANVHVLQVLIKWVAEELYSWCSTPLRWTTTVTLDAHLSWSIMRTFYPYQALATEVLRTNTSLVVLNLESNRITRKGIKVPQYCSMQHHT